jgi:GTP pyrophosphokinase
MRKFVFILFFAITIQSFAQIAPNKYLVTFTDKDQSKIINAAQWAKDLHKDQKRASGEPYFIHPLRVAEILIDMNMDPDTIISALLHDVLEDTNIVFNEIKIRYGIEVANMVEGVTKISILKANSENETLLLNQHSIFSK